MKDIIYFDFDGTLYDSDNLTNMFLKICQKYNISLEEERKAEAILFDERNLFDLDEIALFLKDKFSLSDAFLKEVESLYLMPNLYSDTISALDLLVDSNKYEIIILTYGKISHQEKKINNCGILKYAKDIIITEGSKANVLKVDYKNGIFIDNNPYQIECFVNTKAKKVLRIRRSIDKYSKTDSKVVTSEYTDLVELVKKELL